jgi:protease-4
MFHRLERASERYPLVVSVSNVAASGGYYIGMSSQRLFASPASITGSIGIYGGKADLSHLYEKVELGKELYTRGRRAGMMTFMRPFTDDERDKVRSDLRAFYDHFVELVADNQSLSIDSVDAVGRGQVWTGREAVESGLVSELGGLKEALDYTASELGCGDYRIEVFPHRRRLFAWPAESLFGGIGRLFGVDAEEALNLADEGEDGGQPVLLTRMPFDLHIE